jgi:hypothetical protein
VTPIRDFVRRRSTSLFTVVLVLLAITVLQAYISYSTAFGILDRYVAAAHHIRLAASWLGLRLILVATACVLWLLNRKPDLFRVIIITNGVLTFGLAINMIALAQALVGLSGKAIGTMLFDVLLMAVTNILIFSIWYWVIDPPGVEEDPREDDAWDFLFPQRQATIPHYENWLPRYTDYLYVAFTTTFAFSPTDTMPLTRRAKMLMLLQAAISVVTLTAIAGSAINILAGAN